MQKYVERMVQEKKELDGRIKKARQALEGNPFGMTQEEHNLLEYQVGLMDQYSGILAKRIEVGSKK